ncbi:unnamed protein product, partial [Didymodactylos carnosus]
LNCISLSMAYQSDLPPPYPGDVNTASKQTVSAPYYGITSPTNIPIYIQTQAGYQPVLQQVHIGRTPMQCVCPNCQQSVITSVHHKAGTFAWLLCMLLIFFGCIVFCCLIPFCSESCQDTVHYCPNCRHELG